MSHELITQKFIESLVALTWGSGRSAEARPVVLAHRVAEPRAEDVAKECERECEHEHCWQDKRTEAHYERKSHRHRVRALTHPWAVIPSQSWLITCTPFLATWRRNSIISETFWVFSIAAIVDINISLITGNTCILLVMLRVK